MNFDYMGLTYHMANGDKPPGKGDEPQPKQPEPKPEQPSEPAKPQLTIPTDPVNYQIYSPESLGECA